MNRDQLEAIQNICWLIHDLSKTEGVPYITNNKCNGYASSRINDEPCEPCMNCRFHVFYGDDDDDYPMNREGDYLNTKYPYIVHAELNAILNAPRSVKGCTMYVTLFSCNERAKAIIQSGITKIVFESNKYKDTDAVKASIRMLTDAGVELESISTKVQVDVSELRPWLVTGSKVITYTSKSD